MTKLVIVGSKGRMGQSLVACAGRDSDLQVVGQVDQGDAPEVAIAGTDVVIDFSAHGATLSIAKLCADHRKSLVIGTTGHEEPQRAKIANFASQIPIVWSSNYSTGVNAIFWLTRKTAEILGSGFDVEVVEMHHRMKRDAPSGTAQTLAEILAAARHQQLAKAARHGRSGIVGERTDAEIGIHSIRGGDVVGDHTVIFATSGERVELTHKASSRETFALGALRAAKWLRGKGPGLYDMQDVLGLK